MTMGRTAGEQTVRKQTDAWTGKLAAERELGLMDRLVQGLTIEADVQKLALMVMPLNSVHISLKGTQQLALLPMGQSAESHSVHVLGLFVHRC